MKPGETCTFEAMTYTDEESGREVRRITPVDCRSHHQYFYMNMWTEDSRRVVVSSNRVDGRYRHYLLDVESGQAVCLTDGEPLRPHFGELATDGRRFYYGTKQELHCLDLDDFSDVVIYRQEAPWTGTPIYYGSTEDHSRFVLVEMHADDRIQAKQGWDVFEKQFRAKPRCRLVELDSATGVWRVIHEDKCGLGHPLYRPDGRTIMFCHEGPWNLVDSRLWFVDPDGSNVREGRKRDPERPAESENAEKWGHEFWLPDSSAAAYVYFPGEYGAETTLNYLDPDTLEERVVMPVTGYSHFIVDRQMTRAVGDGVRQGHRNIYTADLRTHAETLVCMHNSSMKPYVNERTGKPNTQEAHPHPCFSPDGKKIVFTSDRHGEPAVYVVDAPPASR